MAGNNSWKVETGKLDSSAAKLGDLIDKYNVAWGQLYTEAEALNKSNWKGIASETFNTRLDGYKNDFEELAKVLTSYKEFLESASKRYNETEDAVKDAAGNLNVGI